MASKPLAADAALAQLRALAPPATADACNALHTLLRRLPAGLPPALVEAAVAHECVYQWYHRLVELPSHLDDAIIAALTRKQAHDPDAAFVLGALRHGERGASRLRELIALAQTSPWRKQPRAALRLLVEARPDLVAGAQAATAVALRDLHAYSFSSRLFLVVADASDESLDLVLPLFDHALRERGALLDRLRKEVAPHLGDSANARRLATMLDDAVAARAATSPALAFVERLGMKLPRAHIKLSVTWRDAAGDTVYQLSLDSSLAAWLRVRRSAKWAWKAAAPESVTIPAEAASYVLRVSAGVDRRALVAWVESRPRQGV